VNVSTGAGKTLVIYELIGRYMSEYKNRSVVLALPYTALCSEKYYELVDVFSKQGYTVIPLFGDNDVKIKHKKAIIVCTLEKAYNILSQDYKISLLCVDEIHYINDKSRGYLIDCILSLAVSKKIRILATTATLTLKDAQLLASIYNLKLFYYEVTKKSENITVYYNNQLHKDGQPICDPVNELKCLFNCLKFFKEGLVLVFTKTIKYSMELAYSYAKTITHNKYTHLNEILDLGIGYHHAHLSINDKQRVESKFKDLKVIFCTTTLAAGINIPNVRMVIVYGMSYGNNINYDSSIITQMVGRCGRETNSIRTILFALEDGHLDIINQWLKCKITRLAKPTLEQFNKIISTFCNVIKNTRNLMSYKSLYGYQLFQNCYPFVIANICENNGFIRNVKLTLSGLGFVESQLSLAEITVVKRLAEDLYHLKCTLIEFFIYIVGTLNPTITSKQIINYNSINIDQYGQFITSYFGEHLVRVVVVILDIIYGYTSIENVARIINMSVSNIKSVMDTIRFNLSKYYKFINKTYQNKFEYVSTQLRGVKKEFSKYLKQSKLKFLITPYLKNHQGILQYTQANKIEYIGDFMHKFKNIQIFMENFGSSQSLVRLYKNIKRISKYVL
jgi:superfamily II DNA/RNA helicase